MRQAVDIAERLGNPATIFEGTGLSFQHAVSAVPAAIVGAIVLTEGATQRGPRPQGGVDRDVRPYRVPVGAR